MISVITNGKGLNADLLEVFSKGNVHLLIPYVGTWDALLRIANSLCSKGVSFSVVRILDEQKVDRRRDKEPSLASLGSVQILKTFMVTESINRPPGGPGDHMIRAVSGAFYHNKERHPCLDGVMAVSAEGHLYSCPFLKNEVLGHIGDSDIINIIFEDRLIDKYWNLNLSKISPCKDCEFRFGCLDCRATEQVLSGTLYEKRLCPKIKIGDKA
jgi:radical SAM protein with 4Fe4S-binding SPASM domain